jgi:hypothetical protein
MFGPMTDASDVAPVRLVAVLGQPVPVRRDHGISTSLTGVAVVRLAT